jgi:23S rRNA U2552 (ribose-2'-O)-methylase RlmE/FtsJ
MGEEILVVDYFREKSKTWSIDKKEILNVLLDKGQESLVKEFMQDENFSKINSFIKECKDKPSVDVKVSDMASVIAGKKSGKKDNENTIESAIKLLASAIAEATKEKKVASLNLFIAGVGIATLLHPPRKVDIKL